MTTTKERSVGAQSKTNLACEVALRTHMCERGVVPSDQLYSIMLVRGTFTGTPCIYAPFVKRLAYGAYPPVSAEPSFRNTMRVFFC